MNVAAFGSPTEAVIVDTLRVAEAAAISLVAEEAGVIHGHIMFSPVRIAEAPGLLAMALAPLAVAPDRQRIGIGMALIRAGLEECRRGRCSSTRHSRTEGRARPRTPRDNRLSMKSAVGNRDQGTLWTVRRLLGFVLAVGFVGTIIELVLLEHDETVVQIIPILLLASAVFLLLWVILRPLPIAVALFRAVMTLTIAGGVLGLVLHFRANLEFQRDLTPTAPVSELFWKVMAAKAPPALAPAVLAQLGCLGLIYAYRFPVIGADRQDRKGEGDDDIS